LPRWTRGLQPCSWCLCGRRSAPR